MSGQKCAKYWHYLTCLDIAFQISMLQSFKANEIEKLEHGKPTNMHQNNSKTNENSG